MGAKQSLEDDLIQFKLTSKQFSRDATRSLAKSEQEQKKVAAEMKRGNMAGAQIYAQNAIREKNTYLQFLKLSSQLDGVASKLEYSIRMQKTSATMANTVKGMSSVMKSMDAVKIAQNMEQFSKVVCSSIVIHIHPPPPPPPPPLFSSLTLIIIPSLPLDTGLRGHGRGQRRHGQDDGQRAERQHAAGRGDDAHAADWRRGGYRHGQSPRLGGRCKAGGPVTGQGPGGGG